MIIYATRAAPPGPPETSGHTDRTPLGHCYSPEAALLMMLRAYEQQTVAADGRGWDAIPADLGYEMWTTGETPNRCQAAIQAGTLTVCRELVDTLPDGGLPPLLERFASDWRYLHDGAAPARIPLLENAVQPGGHLPPAVKARS